MPVSMEKETGLLWQLLLLLLPAGWLFQSLISACLQSPCTALDLYSYKQGEWMYVCPCYKEAFAHSEKKPCGHIYVLGESTFDKLCK